MSEQSKPAPSRQLVLVGRKLGAGRFVIEPSLPPVDVASDVRSVHVLPGGTTRGGKAVAR
ncbi:hypothetical protein ACIPW5_11320 [Streptomyces sp. NPDC090077]|uniref:hypothetical protein n=1 Tax=Streptomyces sp. NPDC090077 TaxID=3365938 RepID=UPI0038258280